MYQKFNVYTPLPAVKNRPRDAIAAWQKAKEIGISYKNGYSHNEGSDHFEDAVIPIFKFEEVTMPQAMKDALQQKQFANPTPVQSQTWPVALSGLDVVGVAETGSGKTLAFGLPAFCHARGKDAARGPSCLVVAPTRELIIQIQAELQTFAPATKVSVAYGGTRVFRVEQCHILCSTPGRLIDLANRGWVNLDQVTYLVLDEADRMLDQSFKRDLDKIVDYIPKERQTLMWTATWPREVARVAASFMPGGWLEIGVGYKYLKASEKIRQIVWAVEYHGKFAALKEILQQSVNAQDVKKKCLIFVNSKRMAEELNGRLRGEGITSWFMSGQLEQRDREQRLRDFREAPAPAVLIATDVLQRGLDIKGLDIVVNYDMPKNIEDYTHRIGRTGRAGVTGDAYTLVVERDCADVLPHLVKVLRESKQEVPEELLKYESYESRRKWGGDENNYEGWGMQRSEPAPAAASAAAPASSGAVANDDWAAAGPTPAATGGGGAEQQWSTENSWDEGSKWTAEETVAWNKEQAAKAGSWEPQQQPQQPQQQYTQEEMEMWEWQQEKKRRAAEQASWAQTGGGGGGGDWGGWSGNGQHASGQGGGKGGGPQWAPPQEPQHAAPAGKGGKGGKDGGKGGKGAPPSKDFCDPWENTAPAETPAKPGGETWQAPATNDGNSW